MNKQNQNELFESFPEIFNEFSKSNKEIQCGDGWYNIVYNLCAVIHHYIESKNTEYIRSKERLEKEVFDDELTSSFNYRLIQMPSVDEISVRFNRLTFYLDQYNIDPQIIGAIKMAQAMSYDTCQHCGSFKNDNHYETCEKLKENNHE